MDICERQGGAYKIVNRMLPNYIHILVLQIGTHTGKPLKNWTVLMIVITKYMLFKISMKYCSMGKQQLAKLKIKDRVQKDNKILHRLI